jgi:membrane associated rhomboid family serine protease/TPR repeat protein
MPSANRPRVTLTVLALLVACFGAEVAASVGRWKGLLAPPVPTLVALGGVVRHLVLQKHEWWRLVAGPLLHGDLVHLGLNGVVLYFAGALVERRVGPARWLTLYGLGATWGALGSTLMNPDTTVSVGASGAGMALLAAVFMLSFREAQPRARTALRVNSLRFLVPSLLPVATSGDAVDLAAHVGGALAGFAVGLAWLREPEGRPFTWPARAAAAGLVAFTAAGVGFTGREVPAQLVGQGLASAGEVASALRPACALGSMAACVELGGALATGAEGLPRDLPAARALLELPCWRANQPEACFFLGLTYHREAPPRFGEAARAYEVACEGEELSACFNLALVLPRVLGEGPAEVRVRQLLERACAGVPRACGELAAHLADDAAGDGVRALELARQACEAKAALGCWVAGRLTGEGRGTARDEVMARVFHEHACNLGLPRGCAEAGLIWLDGVGVARDAARAAGYLEKACAGGEVRACASLAPLLRRGEGLPRDEARAQALLEAACVRDGSPPACATLSAARLDELACEGGEKDRCRRQ